MKSTTSAATIKKLRDIFAIHGLPATLVSDNYGSIFRHKFRVRKFVRKNAIRHIKAAPYHPALNGLAKRAVRTFRKGLEKMEKGSVRTKLSHFLLSYRTTPQSTTGVSPAELLMGRKLHTHLNRMPPSIADSVKDKQCQQKTAHNHHAKEREILEGH